MAVIRDVDRLVGVHAIPLLLLNTRLTLASPIAAYNVPELGSRVSALATIPRLELVRPPFDASQNSPPFTLLKMPTEFVAANRRLGFLGSRTRALMLGSK